MARHGHQRPVAPTATAHGAALDRMLTRAVGAELRQGNALTLLHDGEETYADWLAAIAGARRWIHLENYIFRADAIGRQFAEALLERAAAGVRVRVLYDWWGSLDVPPAFWHRLRGGGIDVRVVHPPDLAAPLDLLARDHSKLLAVDGVYASIGGAGIADQWLERSPVTGLPYRDTAVRVVGPAVADLERAFAGVWRGAGPDLPPGECPAADGIPRAGGIAVRVVAQEPGRMRMLRAIQLVAAAAEERLWIADAYFLGIPILREALMATARSGVDVRLLLPGTNDLRVVGALSRYGYRALLEAGVRIWEYAGPMMHAKTLVADGWWGRVGSTNLNVTGLVTNWEIDLIAEDVVFGDALEAMFERDLADARELHIARAARRSAVRPVRPESAAERQARQPSGTGRAKAGATALRVGGALLQGIGDEQLLRHERTVTAALSATAIGASALVARYPRLLAWPLAALGIAGGTLALLRDWLAARRRSRRRA
jgi:cardiolipin synthase A/B